jgi:hypothetical protein
MYFRSTCWTQEDHGGKIKEDDVFPSNSTHRSDVMKKIQLQIFFTKQAISSLIFLL